MLLLLLIRLSENVGTCIHYNTIKVFIYKVRIVEFDFFKWLIKKVVTKSSNYGGRKVQGKKIGETWVHHNGGTHAALTKSPVTMKWGH